MLNTTKYQEPRAQSLLPLGPAPAVNCAIFSRLEKLLQLRRPPPMSCIYRPFAWPSLLSALIVLLCTASLYPATPDKNPFGLDDYSALHRARALAVAPDGKTVLFVTSYDGEKGKMKREWHTVSLAGENNRKLELPDSFEPQGFTRDGGSLWGLYEVEGKAQLGIVPLTPGKPTQIIALPNGIKSATISPEGSRFVLTADSRTKDALSEG